MRIAVAYWQNRISPVFDEARRLFVVTIRDGREIDRERLQLRTRNLWERVRILAGQKVDVLLCGAISRPLEQALEGSGIRVFGFLSGECDTVLASFLLFQGRVAGPVPPPMPRHSGPRQPPAGDLRPESIRPGRRREKPSSRELKP